MLTKVIKRVIPFAIAAAAFAQDGGFSSFDEEESWREIAQNASKQSPPAERMDLPFPCIPSKWLTWDAHADFLYWQALEENLEPCGIVSSIIYELFEGTNSGFIQNMNFGYKPAFEVGVGLGFDHEYLDLMAEYTRFYATNNIGGSGSIFYPSQLDPGSLLVFINGINGVGGAFGTAYPTTFTQEWQLKMNLVDFLLGKIGWDRKIFKGKGFLGMRAAWIDQQLSALYGGTLVSTGQQVGTADVDLKTTSWGIGARAGLDTSWNMAKGFQFYANAAGDLLYTRYNWHGTALVLVPSAPLPVNWFSDVTQKGISEIRSHLDIELGLKYSCCFNQNKGHFDLSAGYGFQAFFDQNMFRLFTTIYEEIAIVDSHSTLVGVLGTPLGLSPHGNLYIHGLRLSAGISY